MRLTSFLALPIQASEAVITGYRKCLGYQQISAATLAASTGLTLPTLAAGESVGYIMAQAVGMSIPDGGELNFPGDITKIRFILSTSAPVLDVSFFQ